jgi:hypothetical protein
MWSAESWRQRLNVNFSHFDLKFQLRLTVRGFLPSCTPTSSARV